MNRENPNTLLLIKNIKKHFQLKNIYFKNNLNHKRNWKVIIIGVTLQLYRSMVWHPGPNVWKSISN